MASRCRSQQPICQHVSSASCSMGLCLVCAHPPFGNTGWRLNGERTPTPPCVSYALVQATVGVGTVLIWDLILIRYQT